MSYHGSAVSGFSGSKTQLKLPGRDRKSPGFWADAKGSRREPGSSGDPTAGFTMIEIVIVLALLAIIFGLAIPAYQNALDDAKTAQAIGDIKALESEIAMYEIRNRTLPLTLADAGRGEMLDPWGIPYEYVVFATLPGNGNGGKRKDRNLVPINSSYDLYSKGPDGDSVSPLTAAKSQDDIVRANDGAFIGRASDY